MTTRYVLIAALLAAPTTVLGQATFVTEEEPTSIQAELDHADGVYRKGDYLRVAIRTSGPMHVYVLYHQSNGEAVMVFPNTDRRDSLLPRASRYELPAREDEVQCVVRGPFDSEAVQVLASSSPIPAFESALSESPDAVPVMATIAVDAVCAAHAGSNGVASSVLRVTCPAGE